MSAPIDTYLRHINEKEWASEVRMAIVNAIRECYNNTEVPELRTAAFIAAIEAELENGHLTGLDLGDGDVTTAKIANLAVTAAKIANLTITSEKLANGSVTAEKLDPNMELVTVDPTLSNVGEAADAKATGDAINELNGSLFTEESISGWSQGAFHRNTGAEVATDTSIRTNDFVPNNVNKITCSGNYEFIIYAWQGSTTYIGHMQEDGTFGESSTSYGKLNSWIVDWDAGYNYKIVFRKKSNENIIPSEGSNCHFCYFTDKSLTKSDKIADAKAVGDNIKLLDALVRTTNNLTKFKWVQGTFNRLSGDHYDALNTIHTTDFIPDNVTKIQCSGKYVFRIYAWGQNGYVGMLQNNGSYTTENRSDNFISEWTVDRATGYSYKIALYNVVLSQPILVDKGDYCIGIPNNKQMNATSYACNPEFVGTPDTIFDINDVITGIDDCRYNYLNVVKISDSMYYMYYEAFALSDGAPNYPGSRTCFAYSTDGLNFIKEFPQGVTPPEYNGNMILPKGTVTGQFVFLVPDNNYPFRMVGTQGTHQDRITKMWKSADGVNWTYVRQITKGYNDCPAAVVVRGNTLKMFLRTRDNCGRAIGVLLTDLDGNRLSPNWMQVISNSNFNSQFYTSAASAIDDRRELLLPTLYNPADTTESACAVIVDGEKCTYKDMDVTRLRLEDEKSFYIGPGIINIGLDSYVYYVVHYALHDDASTPGQTKSAIRRIKITDTTYSEVVRPHDNQGN